MLPMTYAQPRSAATKHQMQKCSTQTLIQNQITFLFLIFWVVSSMFINEDQYLGHWYILACRLSCLINSFLPINNSHDWFEMIRVGKWKFRFNFFFEANDQLCIQLETDGKFALANKYSNGAGSFRPLAYISSIANSLLGSLWLSVDTLVSFAYFRKLLVWKVDASQVSGLQQESAEESLLRA